MYRAHTYTEASFSQLQPVHRYDVVPGQSIEATVQTVMRSKPYLTPVQTAGVSYLFAFYVPYRLLWSGWIDFVVNRTGTVPTATSEWPALFERETPLPRNSFGRRAYKAIYNQYFGTPDMSWYSNIETDTDTSMKQVRTLDQFLSHWALTGSVSQTTQTAPVTGTAPNQIATINVDQLRGNLQRSVHVRRRDLTGDKYVDALSAMGVKLDWRVQQAPEFLGVARSDFRSKNITQSDYAISGQYGGFFEGSTELKLGKKFFSEHGVVWFLSVHKPLSFLQQTRGTPFQFNTSHNDFFWGDNTDEAGSRNGVDYGMSGGTAVTQKWIEHHYGHSHTGEASNVFWSQNVSAAPPTIAGAVYPANNQLTYAGGTTMPGKAMVLLTDTKIAMRTPVPRADISVY